MKSKKDLILEIQKNPYIIEYKRLENILNNNESLKKEILYLQDLQQQIINLKHINKINASKEVEEKYWARRNKLEENPIIKNYLNLQEEINNILETIKSILEDSLII